MSDILSNKSFDPQISAEALAHGFSNAAFNWLIRQEDHVIKLLLSLQEQPIPVKNIDDELSDAVTKQHIADMIVFGGKVHLALNSIGANTLKQLEEFGKRYNRIYLPREAVKTLSKEQQMEQRFQHKLESFSKERWQSILLRRQGGLTVEQSQEELLTVLELVEDGMLIYSPHPGDSKRTAMTTIYYLSEFGKYCAEKYLQHVYSIAAIGEEDYKILSVFRNFGELLATDDVHTKQSLIKLSHFKMVKMLVRPITDPTDLTDKFQLTALGWEILKLWRQEKQNEHTEN